MKKLTLFQGSPRKNGNTHVMLNAVVDGARAMGAETRLVELPGLAIGECNGCHACWQGRECPLEDDMNPLFETIAASDALVFGTPVYWYGPTALIKALLDRMVYFNCPENRAKIRGKPAALVTPYEETGPEAVAPLVSMFELSFGYLELRFAGRIIAPGIGAKGDILKRPDILEDCRRLGERLGV